MENSNENINKGLLVEGVVRDLIGLKENDKTPEVITFTYNNLIDYTSKLVEIMLETSIKQTDIIVNNIQKNNNISNNLN